MRHIREYLTPIEYMTIETSNIIYIQDICEKVGKVLAESEGYSCRSVKYNEDLVNTLVGYGIPFDYIEDCIKANQKHYYTLNMLRENWSVYVKDKLKQSV